MLATPSSLCRRHLLCTTRLFTWPSALSKTFQSCLVRILYFLLNSNNPPVHDLHCLRPRLEVRMVHLISGFTTIYRCLVRLEHNNRTFMDISPLQCFSYCTLNHLPTPLTPRRAHQIPLQDLACAWLGPYPSHRDLSPHILHILVSYCLRCPRPGSCRLRGGIAEG